uniref:Uncharacterized protein n=1 Tax=Myotis myotis TaxID=51298 RepID=A0A7J7SRJ0_MYOMY|nr:hypothetical protein mMyoMyo1_009408 [Myotis myotis]
METRFHFVHPVLLCGLFSLDIHTRCFPSSQRRPCSLSLLSSSPFLLRLLQTLPTTPPKPIRSPVTSIFSFANFSSSPNPMMGFLYLFSICPQPSRSHSPPNVPSIRPHPPLNLTLSPNWPL